MGDQDQNVMGLTAVISARDLVGVADDQDGYDEETVGVWRQAGRKLQWSPPCLAQCCMFSRFAVRLKYIYILHLLNL